MLIKSVAASYLLTTIYDLLVAKYQITFGSNYDKVIVYFAISALLGFLIGRIISHRWFNFLLHKLHVGRTTNENIWDDVIRPYTWVRVFMKDGSSYFGQYRYGEPFKSDPIIVLATYQKLDKDSDVVIDNSQNMNELIMVNTKDFDRIEIVYTQVEAENDAESNIKSNNKKYGSNVGENTKETVKKAIKNQIEKNGRNKK